MSRIKNKKNHYFFLIKKQFLSLSYSILFLFFLIIFLFFLLLNTSVVSGQTTIRDVEIRIILDSPIPRTEYIRIFRVENLDHVSGVTDFLHFFVNSTLKKNNEIINQWNITRSINKFTETAMGSLTLETGKYQLCTELTPLNFHDYNVKNNQDCKIIMTNDYEDVFNINETTNNSVTSNDTSNNTNISINITNQNNNLDQTNQSNITNINSTNNTNINSTNINNTNTNINSTNTNSTNNTNINSTNINNTTNFVQNNSHINITNICDCRLEIITEKQIYEKGEKISFIIRDCSKGAKYANLIEYWAEDLFNKITKTKIATSSRAPKSYTPRTNEQEKVFLLKANIQGCEEIHQKIIIVKNNEQEKKETTMELITPLKAKAGDIIMLEIKGFKGATQKTLINIQLNEEGRRRSEILKAHIMKSNSDYHLKLPFKIPENLNQGEAEYEILAEGLDQLVKNKIRISTPEKIIISKPEIKRFYTRKQKFEEDINVILTLINQENTSIRITTMKGKFEVATNNTTQTIPIKIKKHNETIIAELLKNNQIHDIKLLKLNLSYEETVLQGKTKTNNEDNSKKEALYTEQNTEALLEPTTKEYDKSANILKTSKETSIEEEKPAQIMTANNTSIIQKYKEPAIFLLIGVVSIILLFKKELKIMNITQKIKQKIRKN